MAVLDAMDGAHDAEMACDAVPNNDPVILDALMFVAHKELVVMRRVANPGTDPP